MILNTKLTIFLHAVPVLRMCGGVTPLHCHRVAVCDPHPSVGPGYAAVTPVTITGHPSMAVACRWCDSPTMPPRPLCVPTLHSYGSQSPVTCHLSWHDVRYSNIFKVSVKFVDEIAVNSGRNYLQMNIVPEMYVIQ